MGLKELDLHLTNSCMLQCNHCVFSAGEKKLPEMDFDRVSKLIDEFSLLTEHKGTINIFGGEVLLRKDIFDIIRKVREEGLSVGVTTNCQVSKSVIDMLLKQDIQRLTSDLDGSTPKTHDKLRNSEGNFNKVIDVLKRSIAEKIFTTVNSVLNTDNIHQVEEILELCENLGVNGLAFYYLTPTGRGAKIADKCIDGENWLKIRRRVKHWIKQNKPKFTVCWEEAYETIKTASNAIWRCEMNHTETVFIRCDGEVYSCALLEGSPCSLGNVNQDKLNIVLEKREKKAFHRSQGCSALAFHAYNDLFERDPRTSSSKILLGCPYNYRTLNGK